MSTIKSLQIEQMDAHTLLRKFDSIEQAIRALKAPPAPQEEVLLTPKDVSDLFKVSLTTIWNWSKKGILQRYRTGNCVRYKRSEVLKAPIPIKSFGNR